ncbi:MAG: polysaccharide pyruvyl transferase family protein [Methanomassiliicoccales archaeon]
MEVKRVLLVGYNGANNTGSEARLLTIIKEVREVLGEGTEITVPTLNEGNLRRYLSEGPHLRIEPIPAIYFPALRRLVREHDLIMLVEGSCYMDSWTSALLWAFLAATRYAHREGRCSLAYGVDAGRLSPSNQRRVRRDASRTDLILTRTRAAADRLRGWGVTADIEVTADNAFLFPPGQGGDIGRIWPGEEVAGMAVVNFNLWPVVIRPWGRRDLCYRWPYYFSHSSARRTATEELAKGLSRQADRLVEEHGKGVALIAMESLDEPLARMVMERSRNPREMRVFSSREHGAEEMAQILRGLDLLITSRYHAGVLSMASGVPQIAVGHDLRLRDLYGEAGILDECFISHHSPRLWEDLSSKVDLLVEDGSMRNRILRANREHVERGRRNKELLREFVMERGWMA